MDLIGGTLRDEILAANVTMFNTIGVRPSPIPCGLVRVDIDVTPVTIPRPISKAYHGLIKASMATPYHGLYR